MRKLWILAFLLAGVTALAASFDCAKAATAQEKAICASPKLSAADDQMAAAYKAALAQTPAEMAAGVRDDQRAWVRNTARSCPAVGKPRVNQSECLGSYYEDRIKQLKSLVVSREGVTFVWRTIAVSVKDPVPDPDIPVPPQTFPGYSALTVAWPQSSSNTPEWKAWNLALEAAVRKLSQSDPSAPAATTWDQALGGSQDADNDVKVTLRSVGKQMVAASIEGFQMGHGAAHPNNLASQFNWLLAEQREVQAKDVFRAGSGWEQALVTACREVLIPQIRKRGEKVEGDGVLKALRKLVADPHNWQIDAKGLTIVFGDSDDLSHAEVPDPITIPWAKLKPVLLASFAQPQ